MKEKKLPTLYKAKYHEEWLPVVWIDYSSEQVMLRKELVSTHKTYLADWKEVDFRVVRRKRVLTKEEWLESEQ